jgi:hypothetical protein
MHKTIGVVVAVGLVCLSPAGLAAQDTLRVDQERIDGSFIENFSVVWRGTPTGADGTVGNSFTVEEEYEVIGEGDDALLKMTQVWNDSLGEIRFISVRVSHRKTMEYRAFHTGRAPGAFGHLDIDEGFVTGMYAPAPEQPARTYGLQLAERPFASMSGIMMASFPLEEGAEFVYPGFGWGGMTNPAMNWQTLAVLDRERLPIPGRGEMRAWKVQQGNVSYWLSKEAPYFLKAESVGGNGQRTTFDVLSWAPAGQ